MIRRPAEIRGGVMEVKLLDLAPQYKLIEDEIMNAVTEVFRTQQFVLGKSVSEFERKMEEYYGVRRAVGTASGSDAILLSLMALGIGRGDEVITTPYTFFSTVSSIVRVGAKPVLVDIDPGTFNIDPEKIERALTDSTAAVLVVHLFGQSAEMDRIMRISRARGIAVIEDACQSIGALHRGRRCGTFGDIGCFSFFPSKNLGGAGDGGMIITESDDLAGMVATLRVHGEKERYMHCHVGINSRLDALQAAVLSVKLGYLDGWNRQRRSNAARYNSAFEQMKGVTPPHVDEYNESTYNQYVIRVPKRDSLKKRLAGKGIGTAVYYPVPLHLQECFAGLELEEGDLPEAEKAARETLALPVYPELEDEKQDYVIDEIRRFMEG